MPKAFISAGTNLGDRQKNLELAIEKIGERCKIVKKSSIYETEPWGVKNQPKFYNMVIEIDTELKPLELLDFLQNAERITGRDRKNERKWGPRIIDLDILTYDNGRINDSRLIVPHPLLKERAFVLIPLYEIYKDKWVEEALSSINKEEIGGIKKVTP